MNREILLNNQRSAAIAGAERRTVVAVVVLVLRRSPKFGLFNMVLQRLIDAGQRGQKNDVKGQYVTKKSHPLILQRQI